MNCFILSIFTVLILQAGEVTLPRDAQREVDVFAAAVEKADTARQVAVNAAVDKAVKALNAAAQKAKSVEERRAIDDEILRISKLKVEVDMLGDKPKNPLIGKWEVKKSDATGFNTFTEDGVVQFSQGAGPLNTGKWTKTETSIRIDWPQGWVDEFMLPINESGTEVKSTKGSGKAVKIKEMKR
jgi:hypothetical protein